MFKNLKLRDQCNPCVRARINIVLAGKTQCLPQFHLLQKYKGLPLTYQVIWHVCHGLLDPAVVRSCARISSKINSWGGYRYHVLSTVLFEMSIDTKILSSQWFPNLFEPLPKSSYRLCLITLNKFFSHLWSKICFADVAHNTEQQCGFGFALPPAKSHITLGGQFTTSLGTTALSLWWVYFPGFARTDPTFQQPAPNCFKLTEQSTWFPPL